MENIEEYYTPDISEFHIGFKFEEYDGREWTKSEITLWTDLKSLFDCEDKCPIPFRVKCLNKQDIESIGFNYGYSFNGLDCYHGYVEDLYTNQHNTTISIYNNLNFEYTVSGISIKNLSELKKLLTMLGIHYG